VWAGRDKPKLVEASNPRRRWPRDPDDLEDAQKRPLRDPFRVAMLELEGEPDGAALITRRCELRRAAESDDEDLTEAKILALAREFYGEGSPRDHGDGRWGEN
jgi:hypothetical protein